MKNNNEWKFLRFIIILFVLFPWTLRAEMMEVIHEYCEVYSGDVKNKPALNAFKNTVHEKAEQDTIQKALKTFRNVNTNAYCLHQVIQNYLDNMTVLRHLEKTEDQGRLICEKVKVTFDPDEIHRYLSQELCLKDWGPPENPAWCEDLQKILPDNAKKLRIALLLETKIRDLDEQKITALEQEEEQQFFSWLERYRDRYDVISKNRLAKVAQENKIPLKNLSDADILKLGKLLQADIIILRILNPSNRITKVRKISTGKVLLFTAYEKDKGLKTAPPETKLSTEWTPYGQDRRGTLHYFKKGDVDSQNNIVKVLNKWVFSKREIADAIQFRRENRLSTRGYHKLSYMVFLTEIDCQSQAEKMLYVVLYDTDDKALYSHTFENAEWQPIQPESNSETLYKAVCK